MSDTEKAETFLMERAMANLIFTNFEHHLKQWLLAIELDDESRQRVLKEEIDFYAEVLMRNPRLLWYWSPEGGGWISGADPSTVAWFQERVLADPDRLATLAAAIPDTLPTMASHADRVLDVYRAAMDDGVPDGVEAPAVTPERLSRARAVESRDIRIAELGRVADES